MTGTTNGTNPDDNTVDRKDDSIFGFDSNETSWVGKMRDVVSVDVGREIGPYRIEREVSRGGQGVVFAASESVTGRRVALKLLLQGAYATELMRVRFERELRAVARLQHPGVVTVLGLEHDGEQPVLALEWVDGESCTAWASRIPERSRERDVLRATIKICEALQHAHGRGILHRDIKPSNIMVTSAGDPKIVDFGVAKILDWSDDEVEVTHTAEFVGTPRYASPEHLGAIERDYDVRSEVFSLAVILFEMLTGELPFERGTTFADAVRTAADQESRRLAPRSSGRSYELSTVVQKALHLDPDQRYASMDAFAADLRRYSSGLPIAALPPSAWYQLKKIAGRNRVAALFAALAIAMFVGFGVFIFVQNSRLRDQSAELSRRAEALAAQTAAAEEARHAAESAKVVAVEAQRNADGARTRAEKSSADAEQMFGMIERLFGELQTASATQIDKVVEGVVEATAQFPAESRGRLHHVFGQLLVRFRRPVSALREFEKAVEAHGQSRLSRLRYTRLLVDIAAVSARLERHAVAQARLVEAIEEAEDMDPVPLELIAKARLRLSGAYVVQGNIEGAKAQVRAAGKISRRLSTPIWPPVELASARILYALGRAGRAQARYDSAVKLAIERFGEKSLEHADILREYSKLYVMIGRLDLAMPMLERAIELRKELNGEMDASLWTAASSLVMMRQSAGVTRNSALSRAKFQELLRGFERAEDPEILSAMSVWGVTLARQGRHDEAFDCLQRAVDLYDAQVVTRSPVLTNLLVNLAQGLNLRAHQNQATGVVSRPDLLKAKKAITRAIEVGEQLSPDGAAILSALNVSGSVHRALGEYEVAATSYKRVIGLLNQAYAKEHEAHLVTRNNYGFLLEVQLRWKALLANCEETIAILSARVSPTPPIDRFPSFYRRCVALYAMGRKVEALDAATVVLNFQESEVPPSWFWNYARLHTLRISVLRAEGRIEEARRFLPAARSCFARLPRAFDSVHAEFERAVEVLEASSENGDGAGDGGGEGSDKSSAERRK